jgi:hypothetical protein
MRPLTALLAAALLGLAVSASASASDPGEARPAPQDRVAPPHEAFEYGPIQAREPEVRAQVEQLYRDQYQLELSARAKLDELVVSLAAETGSDARLELQRQAMGIKDDLQLQTMQLGLQIARLNGDDARVADYESALDHLLNPEKYRPAPLDPSVALERARALGLVE